MMFDNRSGVYRVYVNNCMHLSPMQWSGLKEAELKIVCTWILIINSYGVLYIGY